MFRKGKRIRSQTKEVICSVYNFLENHSKKARISANLLERTAKATSVSRRTVARIRHEKTGLHHGESFATPPKRYQRSRRRINPDDFDREAIRRHIYSLYEEKVNITLERLLVRIQLWFFFNALYSIKHVIFVAMISTQPCSQIQSLFNTSVRSI